MRINGQNVIGNKFAYDGCHKIYICEDNKDIEEAKEIGYDLYDISLLGEYYVNSCELRFINNWQLDKCYAEQGKTAIIEY